MSNDCELITLSGDIDMSDVPALRHSIEAFQNSSAVHAVVDLSDVTFLGSEGVSFVAALSRIARERWGTVTLINASHTVLRAIDICGLSASVHLERHYTSRPVGIPAQRSPAFAVSTTSSSVADLISS